VDTAYTVAKARPRDLRHIAGIELAAAQMLAGHAPPAVLNETTSEHQLREAQSQGYLWVVLADDVPVGFAHVVLLAPRNAHLEEIDVHPSHARRGLGTRLVRTVIDWARDAGCSMVTLTTFRDVPWNLPFYRKLGFEEIPPHALSAALRAVVEDETRRGLDPSRRVVMRRAAT